MKKWILYSTVFTFCIVITGILIVYDVFNFSEGQSQLIASSRHESKEIDVHNEIVGYMHDLGNLTGDSYWIYISLETGSDVNNFSNSIQKVINKRKKLENFIENQDFRQNTKDLKEKFNEEYLPALMEWENSFLKVSTFFEQRPVTEENLNSFKVVLENAHNNFIEAHNNYSDILNDYRRY